MSKIWRFRLLWTFFGLSDEYIAAVYEEFFLMKYYGGWSFFEAYNLPIKIRRWFFERIIDQKEKENKAVEESMNKNSADSGRR